MKRFIPASVFALTFGLNLAGAPGEAIVGEGHCAVDRARMLAMDQQTFDQGSDGWRKIARAGCYGAAADLIRDWRESKAHSDTILTWHEGQMRANAGDYDRAILLFQQSRKAADEAMAEAWNIYVDGSIAFLRADRGGLERARRRLAATSEPLDFYPRDGGGKPIEVRWPPNLPVLDALLQCWGAPYVEAYSCGRSP